MKNIIFNIIFQCDFKALVKLKIDVDIREHSYYIISIMLRKIATTTAMTTATTTTGQKLKKVSNYALGLGTLIESFYNLFTKRQAKHKTAKMHLKY